MHCARPLENFPPETRRVSCEMQPRQLWNTLKQFVADEAQQGRITLDTSGTNAPWMAAFAICFISSASRYLS